MRPRRFRVRRPPPADPYAYDRIVVDRVEESVPRRPVENPWLWLALLAVGIVALLAVVIALLARDDERERAPARARQQAAPRVVVPLAVGADHARAASAVEALGLVADTFPVASAAPAGRVTEQSPAPGTELRRGGVVRLDVSLGPRTLPAAPIPDVTGDAAGAGRAEVRAAGFTVRTLFRDAPSREEVGEVLLQQPAASSAAPGLTQVTLYVGR